MTARIHLIVGLIAALWLGATGAAFAEKNIALVIGNSDYKNVTQLPNPINDAAALAGLFRQAGFSVVTSRSDLGIAEMRRALRDFSDQAKDADIAVVYYAGHGIEVGGTNYLIPVDATLERDTDVEDEAVSLDRVVRTLDPVKRLRLIILDACRDNPFSRSMKRTLGQRSVGRGLAQVELAAGSDTLVAFAAEAGSTAADGAGRNSPFATALVKYLTTPGLDVRFAFGRVRNAVMKATDNKQRPFLYGSLGGDVLSLVPPPDGDQRMVAEEQARLASRPDPVVIEPAMNPGDLARLLQAHLKRVGCEPGSTEGTWDDASQRALDRFNKAAGTSFKVASLDALDAVRARTARVCPLACGKDQKVENDHCVSPPSPRPKAKSAQRGAPRERKAAPSAPSGGGGSRCFTFNGKRFCE